MLRERKCCLNGFTTSASEKEAIENIVLEIRKKLCRQYEIAVYTVKWWISHKEMVYTVTAL